MRGSYLKEKKQGWKDGPAIKGSQPKYKRNRPNI